jgi:hypothetical protein
LCPSHEGPDFNGIHHATANMTCSVTRHHTACILLPITVSDLTEVLSGA